MSGLFICVFISICRYVSLLSYFQIILDHGEGKLTNQNGLAQSYVIVVSIPWSEFHEWINATSYLGLLWKLTHIFFWNTCSTLDARLKYRKIVAVDRKTIVDVCIDVMWFRGTYPWRHLRINMTSLESCCIFYSEISTWFQFPCFGRFTYLRSQSS